MNIEKGDKVVFEITTPARQIIRYKATVVLIKGDKAWVEIPARIRKLPFPPLDGKRYGLFRIKYLWPAVIKQAGRVRRSKVTPNDLVFEAR